MNIESYPEYYRPYIQKVPKGEPLAILKVVQKESLATLVMVSEDKAMHRYAEGKWSIKDIVQHLIDTERIFCFRALAFARGDKTNISGYDHDAYVVKAKADQRSMKSLLEEWKRVRSSTIDLFESFDAEMLKRKGIANEVEFAVEQFISIIIGHEMHHIQIIEQRYL